MVVSEGLRAQVHDRAGYRCEYCHYPSGATTGVLHVEHIIPRSAGGQTRSDNLALACPNCNLHKADKQQATDPITRQAVRLFNPRLDDWDEHLRLDLQTGEIEGLTPFGCATVAALQMNSDQPKKARGLLIHWGAM